MMFASLLLLASTPTYAPMFVGEFNPADFPNAAKIERRMPHADLTARVEKVLASGECAFPGQTKTRFDITVPYAVLIKPDGKPEKVVVKDIHCPQIEKLVGMIGSELANAGDFSVPHATTSQWYVSETYFTRVSEELARELADDSKVICKASRPKINSRISTVKTCRTAAEWSLYAKDREQLRRDMMGQDPKDTNGMICQNIAQQIC